MVVQSSFGKGGCIAQILVTHSGAPGLVPGVPSKIVDVAEVNQWCCLEESGQWLENVDQTHLVVASGKLVL